MTGTRARVVRASILAFVSYVALFTAIRLAHVPVGGGEAFVAFYCAGDASNRGADPYLTVSLRECEHRVDPTLYFGPQHVEPAPLPGYDFPMFRLLARLPYRLAATLWLAASISALAVAAGAVAVLADVPVALTITAFALAPGYLNIVFGEFSPMVLAAIAVGALAMTRGAYRLAAVCSAITAIEPHVGLPAVVSLLSFAPQTRVVLALAGAAGLVLGTLCIGIGGWWEYVHDVLPVHARSEIAATDQLSATAFVHLAGGSDAVALAVGAGSSAAMLLIGLLIARRLRADSLAWLVLVPPAASLVGGAFIHDIQLPLALPAAIYGAARTRRISLWIATFVLAAWWTTNAYTILIGIAASLVVVAVAIQLVRSRTLGVRLATASSIAVLALMWAVHARALGGVIRTAQLEPMSQSKQLAPLASTDWGDYYRERDARREPASDLLGRLMPEFACIIVVGTLAFIPTRRSPEAST